MTMTMAEVLNEYPSSDLEIRKSMESLEKAMESQKLLFHRQIDQLRTIVNTQCKLTGVNPLSQEMAAGALSIKIRKRPRDMLNPKAVKYMQLVFSIKDAVSKKESREISALFGLTVTQVREYFANQRSRVRKMVRLSRDKTIRENIDKEFQDNMLSASDPMQPINPVPLSTIGPSSAEEAPSCSNQDEVLPGLGESEKQFVENIFSSMCKEESFSGQMKLMEWILQIQNPSVLCWFLTKGGVMILATWLSQAASEEQTTVLSVALKVLCHLPLHKALPSHMSVILQAVNKLRFYRISDISNRARVLLSKWSKMLSKSQASKKINGIKSCGFQEMDLSQSIGELIGDDSWKTSVDNHDSALISSNAGIFDTRKMETPQAVKLLTAPDDSNKKFILGTSSIHKERRKVLLVEQPGQKTAAKSQQVKAAGANHARPVTADEIQKAKLRAQLMQSSRTRSDGPKTSSLLTNDFLSASEAYLRPKLEAQKKARVFPPKNSKLVDSHSEQKPMVLPPEISKLVDSPSDQKPIVLPPDISKQADSSSEQKPMVLPPEISKLIDSLSKKKPTLDLKESLLDKCRRVQIPWRAPSEVQLDAAWGVGTGGISKEIEAQKNRMRREKETNYLTLREVPPNPKDPWDVEMDFDDSLTPEIPIDQLPDADGDTDMTEPPIEVPSGSGADVPGPDLELLAVLLKNPELVFALTKGQEIGLSGEDTVKLLDMLKANNGGESVLNGMGPTRMVEVSSLPSPTPHRNNVEVEVSLPSPTPPCRFEVSLPSPTPSINPGPSGWATQGTTKNPFSRQTRMTSFTGDVNSCTLQSQSTSLPINTQFSHHLPSRVSSYVSETAHTSFFATQNPAQINHLAVNSPYSHSTVPQPHLNSRLPNSFSSRVDQNGYDQFVGGHGSDSSRGRDNFYQGGQNGFESWGPENHRNGPQGWGQQDQRGRGYGHGPPDNRHNRGQQNWHGNRRWNEGDRRR